jgi:MFS family permease
MGGDWAAQRFGHSALLRYATGVAVIGIIVATLIPALLAVYIGLVIAGLGVSVMFPELYDAAAKSPGAGRSLGAMTAGSRIAMLFAPAVVGFLADLDALTVGQSIAIVTIPMAIAVLVLTPSDGPG